MTKILGPADHAGVRLPTPVAASRHQGIDALRFALCFAVAMLHTIARADVGAPPLWVVVAASACRGAVPFFFITSGFFTRLPDRLRWTILSRPVRRIGPVYAIWMIVYYALDYHDTGKPAHIGPRELLTGGVALHLWFLPALAVAMVIVPLMLLKTNRLVTWLICLALAAINLAFVGYRDVLHLPEIAGTRAMIAPLLFLLGMELARNAPKPEIAGATLAVVAAWIVTIGEELLIAHFSRAPLLSHSSVATTYIFGMAIFVFAQALPRTRFVGFLAGLGLVSLGIYASHLIFVRFFIGLIGGSTLGRASGTAAAAIVVATLLCLILNRFSATRNLVR